ncbi:MAG TPA: glycosyltransferase family 9 protein [Gammaproteobacteria bacterium]|nr:glycosyltransferase family 9 protein [Gammaproteobacteria bacterium]
MSLNRQNILVIRNDKLGDFMLAWPAMAALKSSLPEARIAVLVPEYTAPLARICPSVDEVIVDPRLQGEWANAGALAALFKPRRFDAVITLFSRFDTGLAVWRAGIQHRMAPATKLAQIFYNDRVPQRRSRSEKPEYEYNLDLVQCFLMEQGVTIQPVEAPYLRFDGSEIDRLKSNFMKEHGIAARSKLVFIHAGHGGSAANLSPEQYAELASRLSAAGAYQAVLSAGPGEEKAAMRLTEMLKVPRTLYISRKGLVEFAKHLAFADLFISGSTGPLHLAAALDRPTAAFYPRRRSSTPLRWQTVNHEDRRLAFTPPDGSGESDMSKVDLDAAAAAIAARFF